MWGKKKNLQNIQDQMSTGLNWSLTGVPEGDEKEWGRKKSKR